MAERIGFTVDRGTRLRAALRGPRLSLGPRIDRIEDEGRNDRWEEHRRIWAARSGGGLVQPPVKGRRARRRKAQEWQTVHDHLERVTSFHRRPVRRAVEPVVAPPDIDRARIRDELMEQATDGIGPLAVLERQRVRRATRPYLDDAVAEREAELRRVSDDERAAAAAWWAVLRGNDPDTVRERLRLAFDEHRFAAAVTAVEADRAHIVVPVAKSAGLVGDREPTESGGARTLPKMTKERRHEVYEAAIGSGVMSTAAEAFAVCPGLGRVAAAVLAPEHVGGPAVLMLVEVARELVLPEGAEHAAIAAVRDVERAEAVGSGRVVIDRGDVSGALRPLDATHPDVAPILSVLETD